MDENPYRVPREPVAKTDAPNHTARVRHTRIKYLLTALLGGAIILMVIRFVLIVAHQVGAR